MRDQAPDIAWMQYGKHLRGQQQTALAGCRKDTPEPIPSPPRADVWSCKRPQRVSSSSAALLRDTAHVVYFASPSCSPDSM